MQPSYHLATVTFVMNAVVEVAEKIQGKKLFTARWWRLTIPSRYYYLYKPVALGA